jgi:hypothetical protein
MPAFTHMKAIQRTRSSAANAKCSILRPMPSHPTLGSSRRPTPLKKITLGLLREALTHNPESVSRILRAVFNLPKVRQDEFSSLLDKTELGHIISASSLIANRVVVLKVLGEIVFEPKQRRTIKERGELDVLIRDNTWIFGESFHFTIPVVGLTKVMNRVSEELALKRLKALKAGSLTERLGGSTASWDV